MQVRSNRSIPALSVTALALVACSTLSSCTSDSDSTDRSKPQSTNQSAVIGGPVEIVERYIAYLADEAGTGAAGTDFNGDLDVIDSIAAVANVATRTQRVLNVSASNMKLVRTGGNGAHLFIATDEALDGQDWDGDTILDDLVLLHTNLNTSSPVTFVSLLGDTDLEKVGDRVYFSEVPGALVAPDTSLMFVDTAAPLVPVRVANADVANTLQPELMTSDEGMLFLSLDETVEGRDLNGDADATDTDVLALLDGTDVAAAVVEVGLALQDDTSPVRALDIGSSWVVAFLVDETAQGATNLNDATLFAANWKPAQCVGFEDADTTDEVLHFLDYTAFLADPIGDAPINSGLVGSDRVLVTDAAGTIYVAAVSSEADEGTCDLNQDTDTLDDILRWAEATSPVLPFTSSLELTALAAVNGGTNGVTDLNGRFVAVISEADDGRDHDGFPGSDDDLVAWLDPDDGNAAIWEFDHSSPGAGAIDAVGTAWVGAQADSDTRVGIAFPEAFFGDINGDGDTLDSVPTFARFNGAGTELDFPGPAVAIDDDNAGVTIVGNTAFYRVDENADDRDWNGDGDRNDFALFRTTVSTLQNSNFIGTHNGNAGPAVIAPDPSASNIAIAFLADEAAQNVDFNNDGDTADQVLRWFRID